MKSKLSPLKALLISSFTLACVTATQAGELSPPKPSSPQDTICEDTGSHYKMVKEGHFSDIYQGYAAYFQQCSTGLIYTYKCSELDFIIKMSEITGKNNPIMALNSQQYQLGKDYHCPEKLRI